ncbi:ABC transporter permease [Mucilaginibacter pocheonensis]|uniref:ABC transport system permease protein n=1 Tax=Mucilaginibacter pocheonensis TaxID=398050 RepID=A0ABU1TCU1_9SPHI|nr:ABC transporter permease [Mucilaginibacter pocheonensis]MDR6943212.1 putative ABC transport system permease protein [Mucilaginibacter pocheonensis]
MIKNYLKTAWRNIIHNKFYAAINVAGLTLGLVIGLFMLLWVQDELSFDGFNKKGAEIYRIGIVGGTDASKQIFTSIIAPVATFAKNELPEVEDGVRIMNVGNAPFKYKDKIFNEQNVAFTDPSYFSVFDFHLINGNAKDPFPDNNSIVITNTLAKKYFGNDDPIGKTVIIGLNESVKVTGVISDYPANSSIKCNVLLPLSRFNQLAYIKGSISYNGTGRMSSMDADWINFGFETYLLLKPNTNIASLEKKLQSIHERNKPDDAPVPYLAQPLLNMHLYRADGSDGGIETVRTFAIVAILILVIACINYVNLSTARSMLRAKEVSMRKIIGAGKFQLFMQFMAETTMLFVIATLFAIGLMYILMPLYNSFSGKHLELAITNYEVWIYIAVTLLGTLAASSIYPALLLSSFEPLKALKGRVTAGIGNAAFRKVLVVLQFTVSVMLIIGTLVISKQLKYIRSKNLGYDKENVLSFSMRDMQKHYDAVKADLLKQPGVLSVSRGGSNIIDNNGWTGDNDWEGKSAKSSLFFHPVIVDKDFISFFNMKMKEGKVFTGAVNDTTHFILNEAAVTAMGLKDPVGKRIRIQKTKGTIIGVVKDFHYTTMRKKIEPAVLVYSPENCFRIYIKTTGKDAQKAIAAAQRSWKQYNNDIPLAYSFLDENFSLLYKADERTGSLFNMFSMLAIVISCLGLFGLATYSAQVKTREIGIRKVLGSSVAGIIRLLAAEFIILIIISIFIAVPVAWYATNKWLQDYAYKINVTAWVFLIAGGGATLVALATISIQSVKAALANPVKSLRSE